MTLLGCVLTLILSLAMSVRSGTGPAGKDFCYYAKAGLWGEEFRLSFTNSSHMAYRVTEFFIPSPGKSRFPSIIVRGIPYKYNATSGIIDADTKSIAYNIFYRNVKSSDMHRIQYDESVDEVKLKIRYELVQRRKYRTFRRCY
ncbi:hypothetical protein FOZ60_004088 [Perkinsus olseni]|uniref:Uncharacterized protein n=1 Tax=Perkinsus olseni TaxID=32597 RepID=A0A7J6PJG3_PEROL|nr:hypothetical protein FOZ60_004088 [Perkinsus olseni]